MFNERNTKRVVTIRGFGERCDVDVVERNPLVAGQRHTEGTQHAHMEECLGYRHIGVFFVVSNGLLDAAFLIARLLSFKRRAFFVRRYSRKRWVLEGISFSLLL